MHHGLGHMVGYTPARTWDLGVPMLLTSGGDHYRLVQTCSLEDLALVPIVLTSSGGHRSGPYASYSLVIDASTSRSRDVTNIAGFWSKRAPKNHWSQWEPRRILLLFLNVSLKSLLLFHDQLVLISLHHIWVKIASNYVKLLFKIGIFCLILTCFCVFFV